jgi:hypothetical protein
VCNRLTCRLFYLTFPPIDPILNKNLQAGGIMIRKFVSLSVAVFIELLFTASLLASTAQANPASELHVCASGCPYSAIQAAVDAAANGDVIKIAAGTYTGVSARSGVTQVVYLNKSLTLQGGYAPPNWTTSDPEANPTTIDAQGQGRVMFITLQNKAVTLDGLRLIGGSTTSSGYGTVGGGIYALGWSQGSAITLTRNQVLGNRAGTYGGGLAFWAITVTLTSTTIASNTVPGGTGNLAQGGGVYLANAIARLTDNAILSNTTPIGDYYGDSGGGVYAQYSSVMLAGNTFANNQAEQGGGLSALRTPLTLSGNTFVSNTAGSGGGGLYYGADTDASAIITLTNNSFMRNSAAGSGGGAWLTPLKGTLTGNVFEHNLAGDGGALLVNSLTLQDNRIVSNTATYHGGGLYLTWYPTLSRNIITGNLSNKGGGLAISGRGDTNPLLINNLIADNRVTALPGKNGWGSAVYIEDASARLLHTTIARNTGGDGSGLYMTSTLHYYGTLAMTNTIVVSHPIGLKITGGHTATLNGVLWFSSPVTLTAAAMTTVSVQSQSSGDPKFALDGYHILSGSAAIDQGINAGVTTDIDNQPRPKGSAPDLGADEWYPPLDQHIYLPLVIK